MRVNPNITPDLLDALARSQQDEETAMLELSSGRRVNVPADDPAASSILVQNHSQASRTDQYLSSAASIQSQLQTADSALSAVISALGRAATLGVEGANGTLSTADRAALVNELQGVQGQLLNLANVSYQGQYIFGGTETTTRPYVADPSQASGVRYQGNGNTNSVAVGDDFSVQANLPGTQLFSAPGQDMFQSIQDLIGALQANTGVDTATASVRASFDYISAQRTFYGNTMNQIDSQTSYLNTAKLQLSAQEDSVGGADMATATTRLLNAETARSATLSAAGRIWQSTLFDYLK